MRKMDLYIFDQYNLDSYEYETDAWLYSGQVTTEKRIKELLWSYAFDTAEEGCFKDGDYIKGTYRLGKNGKERQFTAMVYLETNVDVLSISKEEEEHRLWLLHRNKEKRKRGKKKVKARG